MPKTKKAIILLAAGEGKRSGVNVPKPLIELAGKPMLAYTLDTIAQLTPDSVHLVIGHQADRVREAVENDNANWCEKMPIHWHIQDEKRGTAHAVACALPEIATDLPVLVLYADMPLLSAATCASVLDEIPHADLAFLTAALDNPHGYGRVVRNDTGQVRRIVEEADAEVAEKAISEVNVGVMAAQAGKLQEWIRGIGNDNQQSEYYLTDCIGLAVANGHRVATCQLENTNEAHGVNTLEELETTEHRIYQNRSAALRKSGVRLRDSNNLYIRGEVKAGKNACIDVGVIFAGKVQLGNNVEIGPYCYLKDVSLGDGTQVKAFSHLDTMQCGERCVLGPYARIRPETVLANTAKVGNFVEIKNSKIGEATKVGHLSYVGDSTTGKDVNIGAGTVTCNYDGKSKHRTTIEDDVFIGSNTEIIAPVRIGKGATIGAGSTITRDAEEKQLTLSRSKQHTVPGWKRPRRTTP